MILLILVLAFILRLININQSFWLDEATQAILSSKSLEYIWFQRSGDFHPPLSYILTHFWLMGGTSEAWLRLLPVLFGVGTVYGVYKIAQKMINKQFGLLSALLLSLAPYHIYYSQELRMYSMATFFATWSMYFLLKSKSPGFIITTLGLLLSHYLGFFVLISQFLFMIICKRSNLKWLLRNLLITLMIWGLWLPQFLIQLKSGINIDSYLPGWKDLLSLSLIKSLPLTFIKFSIGRIDFDSMIFYGMITLVTLIVMGGLLALGIKKAKEENRLLVFWLSIPILLALLISFMIPLFQPFRLLMVLPAFYILIALGIWYLGKWRKLGLTLVILISVTGLLFFNLNPKFWREDWKGATKFVDQKIDKSSSVVFAWPISFPPYEWYGGKQGIGVVKQFPASQMEINKNMNSLSSVQDIYFFEYLQSLSDPNKNIQQWFNGNRFDLKETSNFNGVGFIHHYHKRSF